MGMGIARTIIAASALGASLLIPATAASAATDVFYAKCDDARTAGVAPLNAGDPGYRAGLDGDGDGIACEDGESGSVNGTSGEATAPGEVATDELNDPTAPERVESGLGAPEDNSTGFWVAGAGALVLGGAAVGVGARRKNSVRSQG